MRLSATSYKTGKSSWEQTLQNTGSICELGSHMLLCFHKTLHKIVQNSIPGTNIPAYIAHF
jgi:hypothetical protein